MQTNDRNLEINVKIINDFSSNMIYYIHTLYIPKHYRHPTKNCVRHRYFANIAHQYKGCLRELAFYCYITVIIEDTRSRFEPSSFLSLIPIPITEKQLTIWFSRHAQKLVFANGTKVYFCVF